MNIRNRKVRGLAMFLLACLCFTNIALGEEQPIQLGPLFSGRFDPAYVRSISDLKITYLDAYGQNYCQWPHEVRTEVSSLVAQIGDLPKGTLLSQAPEIDDLDEATVAAIAWPALTDAYPAAKAAREWYEESYGILFGTRDSGPLHWYAVYLPYYTFPSNMDNTTPNPRRVYTVEIDRTGHVVDVIAHVQTDDQLTQLDESTDPLDVFLQHLYGELRASKPAAAMTDEEKLDYNISQMITFLQGDRTILGLPGPDNVPHEEALAMAREYAAQREGVTPAQMEAYPVDASFLVGDNTNGDMRPAEDYPIWFVYFIGDEGHPFIHITLDAETGALLSYQGPGTP